MRSIIGVLILVLLGAVAGARPAQVQLIRHAEKPDDGGSDLSDRGWERARALPSMYKRAELTRFGLPVALFAMKPKKSGKSIRAVETLKYLALDLHLPIDSEFEKEDVDALVRAIMTDHKYDNKMVLICWEHKRLEDIAEALKVKEVPKWPGDQFDRVWVIDFDTNGHATMTDVPEKLLAGDSEE